MASRPSPEQRPARGCGQRVRPPGTEHPPRAIYSPPMKCTVQHLEARTTGRPSEPRGRAPPPTAFAGTSRVLLDRGAGLEQRDARRRRLVRAHAHAHVHAQVHADMCKLKGACTCLTSMPSACALYCDKYVPSTSLPSCCSLLPLFSPAGRPLTLFPLLNQDCDFWSIVSAAISAWLTASHPRSAN